MTEVDLELIAARLEGLEETIIHRLIDRAQFAANPRAYERGQSGFQGAGDRSLFDIRLRAQEEMDAEFGRYEVPEERPFHRDLPSPRRRVTLPPSLLAVPHLDDVNLTREITTAYLAFLRRLCAPPGDAAPPRPAAGDDGPAGPAAGDDGQYGSSVEHDVLAIQAIARRVHFGALYVAESKYRAAPAELDPLIDERDEDAILARITRPEVETRIVTRVRQKVDYVQATINERVRRRIDPELMLSLYRDLIIPLTKRGEVRYLYARERG